MEKKNFLITNDAEYFRMLSYFDDRNSVVFGIINEKRNRLDKSKFTYRIINHWQKEGLISDDRPSGKGWRMYSLMDVVWLNIITELRKFGYPLEKIKKVKESLIAPLDSLKEKHQLPMLEMYVATALIHKTPAFLLVFDNGEALAVTHKQMVNAVQFKTIGNHIQLSINAILQKIYPKKDMKPQFETFIKLSDEEFELMAMVRTGNYESITIKKKDGKIERLEATESIKADKRITELLQSGDFQNIEIKQVGGKVVCVKRTIKKKVSK